MLWMGDATGRCVYLNHHQREFWGVAAGSLEHFDWNATLHPDDVEKLAAPFMTGMNTRTGFSVEARYRRADGSWRILRTEARPRFSEDGTFLGMVGVNTDVTDALASEAAVQRKTGLLEILNRTGAAIAAELDLDTIVQTVTDASVEMTGARYGAFFYNVYDDTGRYILYSLSGAPREAFDRFPMPRATAMFEPTFRGSGVVRSDDILADPRYGHNAPHQGMPAGHLKVRSYLAVPVVSRNGEVIGGLFLGHPDVGVFKPDDETLLLGLAGQAATAIDNARLFQSTEREIAGRIAVETELRELNDTLESRVAAEIAEKRQAEAALAQAQKMEAIGNLTGGVAHDFNNLLMAVSGSLELLRKRLPADPSLLRLVDNALEGARRGASLTKRMLAFARRQDLRSERIEPGQLVAGMTDLLQRSLGPMIVLETEFAAQLPGVETDPNQLESALLNLAVNARDAMQGSGRLRISGREAVVTADDGALAPGRYVCLAISDTGEGMDEATLQRATEPFFTTKGIGKGTGLGLSMVQGLAQQSGGTLRLHSKPGEGTTAEIWLPALETGTRSPVVAEMPPPAAETTQSASLPVLAVDDDALVLMNTAAMLEDLGHTVVTAYSGPEALDLLARQSFDLVVTDHAMPRMTGAELAERIRADWPGLPIMLATGYAELPHGADAGLPRLSKPFSQDELAQALTGLCRKQGRTAPQE